MIRILIIHVILTCTILFVRSDETLEQQNSQHQLNPVNDHVSSNALSKDHDKRTIFDSNAQNFGWAKHIGHHPSGFRYVIGYGPLHFKYVPVLRPPLKLINHHHYIHRPRWPTKLIRPVVPLRQVHDHGWRPIQPLVKPVLVRPVVPVSSPVPVVKPVTPVVKPVVPIVAPVVQWPNKSWQQDEWKQKPILVKPVLPVSPVNVVSVQPILKPHPPPQIITAHPGIPVQSLIPSQPLIPAQPVAHPVAVPNPWVPSVKPSYPLVPQQQLFVIKPNVPVVPFVSGFSTTNFQQVPTGPGIVVQKPHLIPQNVGTVEYHGTHSYIPVNGFINFPKLASIPQYAPQFIQPLPYPSPVGTSGTQIQQSTFPSLHAHSGQPTIQFPSHQQQLPQLNQIQHFPQQGQQTTDEQYQPPLAHGQLPLEGDNPDSQIQTSQFFDTSQSNLPSPTQEHQFYSQNYLQQEQFQTTNNIQPGQTDVQTPMYLPPHPGFNPQAENFNNGYSSQFSTEQDDSFKPSPVLETPYSYFGFGRREDVDLPKDDESYERNRTSINLTD